MADQLNATAPTEGAGATSSESPVSGDTSLAAGGVAPEQEAQSQEPIEGLYSEESANEAEQGQDTHEPFNLEGLNPYSEDTEIDEATATEFARIAQENGLSQEQFNNVFNQVMPYLNERVEEQIDEARSEFLSSSHADKDIGGRNWDETMRLGRSVLKRFMPDEETQQLFRQSCLDCHPGVIRMFRDIGRALSEDQVVRSGASTPTRDAAKAFFNNSNMN